LADKAAERRAKATVRNLVYSMLVTLGIVLLLILGVPRDDSSRLQPVDYRQVAMSATNAEGYTALAPDVPAEWYANAARIDNTLGVRGWYVGFVTDENEFIGLSQAFESNLSWEAELLKSNLQDGEIEIAGLTWEIWPTRNPSNPPGTKEFALKHNFNGSSVVIYGTADRADFELIATSIADQIN